MSASGPVSVHESTAAPAVANGGLDPAGDLQPSRARTSLARLAVRIGGGALGLCFLWVAADRIDFRSSLAVLSGADFLISTCVLILALAFMALKAVRWAWILAPVVPVRFGLLHRLVYVGTAANILLPHSGELIRSVQLARACPSGLHSGTVLGTVAIERLLDFAALTLFAVAAIVIQPAISQWLWLGGASSLALVLIGVGLIGVVLNPAIRLRRVGLWLVRRLPPHAGLKLQQHVRRGIEGLGTLRSPRQLLVALLLSVLQWAMVVLAIALSFQAVAQSVTASAAIAIFALTVIGLTLPSAPGQVGTTQLAFVAGVTLTGGADSAAFAASIIYNVWFVIATMLIGGVLWLMPARA